MTLNQNTDTHLTKVSVLSKLPPVLGHALSQQPFSLRIARVVHLTANLGHGVQHGQFGSRCCENKGNGGETNRSLNNLSSCRETGLLLTWVGLKVL